MKRSTVWLSWLKIVLLAGIFVFPLWRISLSAPQYPDGLGLRIWATKVVGAKQHDLKNINLLNHYIGMKEIHSESIPELRYIVWIVLGLIGLGLLWLWLRKRWLLALWVLSSVAVGVGGLVDFYIWEYNYGHNLNPDAPIKVPGMSYQPPLLGSKKLLNITATSYPDLGGIMFILAILVGVFLLFREGRLWWKSRRRNSSSAFSPATALVLFCMLGSMGLLLSACKVEPRPIRYHKESCAYCRMMITDPRYGTELLTKKGRVHTFDSVECMAAFVLKEKIPPRKLHSLYATNFNQKGQLIQAEKAVYLHSPKLPSPMSLNISAYATKQGAQQIRRRYGGKLLDWEQVKVLVREKWLRKTGALSATDSAQR